MNKSNRSPRLCRFHARYNPFITSSLSTYYPNGCKITLSVLPLKMSLQRMSTAYCEAVLNFHPANVSILARTSRSHLVAKVGIQKLRIPPLGFRLHRAQGKSHPNSTCSQMVLPEKHSPRQVMQFWLPIRPYTKYTDMQHTDTINERERSMQSLRLLSTDQSCQSHLLVLLDEGQEFPWDRKWQATSCSVRPKKANHIAACAWHNLGHIA